MKHCYCDSPHLSSNDYVSPLQFDGNFIYNIAFQRNSCYENVSNTVIVICEDLVQLIHHSNCSPYDIFLLLLMQCCNVLI